MTKSKGAPRQKTVGKLPSRQEIIDFLATASKEAGKREIARAFGIKGGDRIALKGLLRAMADDGLIAGSRRKLTRPGVLPPVTVIEIAGRDADGEFIARPAVWDEEHGPAPRIVMAESRREAGPVAGIGDRVLARITATGPDADYPYQARTIKRLARAARSLLGIFRALPGGTGVIDPVDRKQLREWPVARGGTGDAEPGELVRFEIARASRMGVQTARVTERLGNPQAQQTISLIAVHAHGIPDRFPEAALAEAAEAKEPDLKRREDLRHLPLVTIDPSDARDHDDAVWAEADPNPANRGGWVVIVAIADVASYVRPGSELDKEARKRGNSVYFPDRVVPMLPERISNDLCSLVENEPRPCLAVRMVFDKDGTKLGHRFYRAVMRSAASLTYEQAQGAIDGRLDEMTGPLLDTVLRPLWGAYASLMLARTERGPLELDLPERKILLDDEGRVRGVATPPRTRCPPSDRGVHDCRQCRRGRNAGGKAIAADLSRPRQPVEGETRCAWGVPDHHRTQAAQIRHTQARPIQSRAGRHARHPDRRAGWRGHSAEPGPSRICGRQFRPFRIESAPLCPFHLPDPPLRRSCRPSRAGAGPGTRQ